MILKIKAFIYRYTSIYLASKEELKMIYRIIDTCKLSQLKNVDVYVGMWQAQNGFTVIYCPISSKFRKIKWLERAVFHLELFIRQLINDIRNLY